MGVPAISYADRAPKGHFEKTEANSDLVDKFLLVQF